MSTILTTPQHVPTQQHVPSKRPRSRTAAFVLMVLALIAALAALGAAVNEWANGNAATTVATAPAASSGTFAIDGEFGYGALARHFAAASAVTATTSAKAYLIDNEFGHGALARQPATAGAVTAATNAKAFAIDNEFGRGSGTYRDQVLPTQIPSVAVPHQVAPFE
jgi:hypothetical protein